MAEKKSDGSVTKPQGSVVPGATAKPAVAPGNTKPKETGKSNSPLMPGTPEFLVKDAKGPDEVFNDEATGYIGVDPIYQNAANATDKPIVEGEAPVEP